MAYDFGSRPASAPLQADQRPARACAGALARRSRGNEKGRKEHVMKHDDFSNRSGVLTALLLYDVLGELSRDGLLRQRDGVDHAMGYGKCTMPGCRCNWYVAPNAGPDLCANDVGCGHPFSVHS
jgi:hypothetical protein